MKQVTEIIVQVTDIDKEVHVPDGTIFIGCQLRQHEISVWILEPTQSKKPKHAVFLTAFPELGSVPDDAVYVGFCGNVVFAEDEIFHVFARSETLDILVFGSDTTQMMIERFRLEMQGLIDAKIAAALAPKKPGRPPKEVNNEQQPNV